MATGKIIKKEKNYKFRLYSKIPLKLDTILSKLLNVEILQYAEYNDDISSYMVDYDN